MGSGQGSSGEKAGTGYKAFVGEALAPSDLDTLKFSPLWESPKYPSCHQSFLIEQQEMRPGVKGGKLKETVRKKVKKKFFLSLRNLYTIEKNIEKPP